MKLININHLLSLISDHSLFPHNTPTVNWFGPLSPQCRCYRLSFPCPCDNFCFLLSFLFPVFLERKKKEKKSGTNPGEEVATSLGFPLSFDRNTVLENSNAT